MREYLDFVRTVAETGNYKPNRTGVDTISSFSHSYKIDLTEGFPLLTTKKMDGVRWRKLIGELAWYLSGDAHIRNLDSDVWDEWSGPNGELDTSYARFWRRFPLPKEEHRAIEEGEVWADTEADGARFINDDGTFDQIAYVVDMLKHNPKSRRIVLNAWHPANASVSKLPPCHFTAVFNVQGDTLNTHLTQRSGDIALGVPFNIATYAALTYLLAQEVGLKVGEFSHHIVDSHIYCGSGERGEWYAENLDEVQERLHTEGPAATRDFIESTAPTEETAKEDHLPGLLTQLTRDPYERPTLTVDNTTVDTVTVDDFNLEDYTSDGSLSFTVAE